MLFAKLFVMIFFGWTLLSTFQSRIELQYAFLLYPFCINSELCLCSLQGKVVIIRGEGPKGGPGMPEMLTPTSAIMGAGLGKVKSKCLPLVPYFLLIDPYRCFQYIF